jgi:lysophospholipase L1-like esterase
LRVGPRLAIRTASLSLSTISILSLELSAAAYQAEFRSFADEEQTDVFPARPILFYGSSSIRLWSTLRHDFDGLPVINRGFGGSTLEECVELLDRLVAPVKPRAIVLYAGDNDLDQGASPETVLSRFERFAGGVRMKLGWTPVVYISVKPCPARFWNSAKIEAANELIARAISLRWREAVFVDIYQRMLDEHGAPRVALFDQDGLHLSPAGYAIWSEAIQQALAETGLQREPRVP